MESPSGVHPNQEAAFLIIQKDAFQTVKEAAFL
jgi:hypothetical protein